MLFSSQLRSGAFQILIKGIGGGEGNCFVCFKNGVLANSYYEDSGATIFSQIDGERELFSGILGVSQFFPKFLKCSELLPLKT